MDRKIDDSALAETVASNSISGPATGISRVTSVSEEEGRFVPGTLLGGRYRILTLLGRGGMGEVYRAMDLTLGQSVALKFLPEEAANNQRLLERFHGEVRVARLVSHPNVCRVYDIGQVEGMPFISMEYVDGEDLASLLTRIGRLPADKAIEAARRLCSGLAAAHDRGVIHRDLKPQNIMMNKRGEVVIMDFGLAAIASELTGPEARFGTPAYMSPEQLKGDSVTPKSDIYALGLVLYELFTGKKPFEASSVQQMIDMQEAAQITSVTSTAADIDPAVDQVIRRCLAPDPAKRPASALAVLAALPGGDPLAAALAAGETPSPEMVAAAGKVEGMPRRYSVPCLALVIVFLLASIPVRQVRTGMVHGGLDQTPDVLAHQAREYAAMFGYTARPADSAVWLEHRGQLLGYLRRQPRPHNWDQWLAWEPAIRAVYRESPLALKAAPFGQVEWDNPPQLSPGMTRANLDGNGRLTAFSAVPLSGEAELTPPIAPETIFRALRLDPAAFIETAPIERPVTPFDQRRAWKGPHPHLKDSTLQVEAAWWKGRVVRVSALYPWQQADIAQPKQARASVDPGDILIPALIACAVFFVILLARRNWVKERADRQGAFRIAIAVFVLSAIRWSGLVHPIASSGLLDAGVAAAADWLMDAASLCLIYLALEPEVRARWPHSIVTWNRVLVGKFDAQVASHILIGAAVGTGLWVVFKGIAIFLFNTNEPTNWDVSLHYLLGARQWIGANAGNLSSALGKGLVVFLTIFAMRQVFRRDWLAALAAAALFTITAGEVRASGLVTLGLLYASIYASIIFVLLRCGLVASIVAVFFADSMNAIVLGGDWSAWYLPASIATMLLLIGIAIWAFWRSLGGRELLEPETP
ncbi:MAG TPA: serine/threonine-protein kinase [Candidatus Solibacter sp.]|nr:serine/threonine-protein kinase [Candidatus Solibacter sp.]